VSDDISLRLARLDACAVSDALDQLGLPASVTGLLALSVRRRVSGRVTTVKLSAGRPPAGSPSRHLGTAAVDASAPGSVIVVEQRTGVQCAGWGGILSNAARRKGLSGVIIDGLARDVDEAADIGFAVYARGATARTARGRIYESETGGTISVGDLAVKDGDYVVADSSGAAFIPGHCVLEVLTAAERVATKEAVMTKSVLAGVRVSDVMGANYENLLESDNK
jgi:4-hydroxy-4-methyl-2-oxoglutarate aldolase